MIPKKIHYCWFGKNPLPPLAQKCIESWKKFCPNYEIIEWNEDNFDVNSCKYTAQAYSAKKWAFVSDYARFKILYEQGGLYFDTDVELVKPIDEIVALGSFMASEHDDGKSVNIGLGVAAEPGLEIYKTLIEKYNGLSFIGDDGEANTKTIVEYTSELLVERGLKKTSEVQTVSGLIIYPKEYFCPIDYATGKMQITPKTLSVHHYDGSWHSPVEEYASNLRKKLIKFLPRKLSGRLAYFMAQVKFNGFSAAISRTLKKLKRKK